MGRKRIGIPKDDLKKRGRRLKDEATLRGLSAADMASLLNYADPHSIYEFYSGKRPLSDDRYEKLVTEWGVRKEYLLCHDNYPTEEALLEHYRVSHYPTHKELRSFLSTLGLDITPVYCWRCDNNSLFYLYDRFKACLSPSGKHDADTILSSIIASSLYSLNRQELRDSARAINNDDSFDREAYNKKLKTIADEESAYVDDLFQQMQKDDSFSVAQFRGLIEVIDTFQMFMLNMHTEHILELRDSISSTLPDEEGVLYDNMIDNENDRGSLKYAVRIVTVDTPADSYEEVMFRVKMDGMKIGYCSLDQAETFFNLINGNTRLLSHELFAKTQLISSVSASYKEHLDIQFNDKN